MIKQTACGSSMNAQQFYQEDDNLTKTCDRTNGVWNTKNAIPFFGQVVKNSQSSGTISFAMSRNQPAKIFPEINYIQDQQQKNWNHGKAIKYL